MTADQYFIGIDSGTQGTKVVISSRRKRAIVAQTDVPTRKPLRYMMPCSNVILM